MKNKRLEAEEIRHIAELSRLHFEESELLKISDDMNEMLDFVSEIGEFSFSEDQSLDLSSHKVKNALRDDETAVSVSAEKLVASLPYMKGDYIEVPRVVESEVEK